jgi:hypothetical protein
MRHPFHDANPRHLDCGELLDARTGEYIAEATASQAARSLKARRFEGIGHGVIRVPEYLGGGVGIVVPRKGTNLTDWRLAVALKLRWERSSLLAGVN